ncbi:MAG TPA: mechanosensitive ion channel protein MscS [Chryseobacterium sp.]|nr:mechanosensitive ion channel protein MscS [Chryseobacterium sp.]
MNDQLKDTKDFIQDITEGLFYYIGAHFPDGLSLFFQVATKILLILFTYLIFDFIFKICINSIFRLFRNEERYPVMKSIQHAKITNSFAHLFALLIAGSVQTSIFLGYLKKTTLFSERMINFAMVLVIAGLAFRSLRAFGYYSLIKKDYYRNFAIRTVSETLKIVGIFIFSVIGICVIFGINSTTIIGSLGAITAIMVLVFRDTILGFVTGLNVATSRNMKVGDWIAIPKYSIEGYIEDIGLLTTKIKNFDKTISTIPTYDLLSTEIRNYQVISDENTRRIKKSIVFNMKSLNFVDDELMARLKKINLIQTYINNKEAEIKKERAAMDNPDEIINGNQLTNIGVFRKYVQNYLKSSGKIDQKELILVRQLQSSPEGLPLEIYCFATEADTTKYEAIQSDIFDHLLSAAKEFELEVVQKA